MIKHTFTHIKGIGEKQEEKLWQQGITDWQTYLTAEKPPLSNAKHAEAVAILEKSHALFEAQNWPRLCEMIPARQNWRLFHQLRESIAYLDIETTGMSIDTCEISTISIYDGRDIFTFVNGENLEEFEDAILNYNLLITFNGRSFDVPFIERFFRTRIPHAHVDLMHVLRQLGYTGGLKKIEKELGIDRRDHDLGDVSGGLAVTLWQEYQKTGNQRALDSLLAYNIADVVNLEYLMFFAHNRLVEATPFAENYRLSIPSQPEISFKVDRALVEQILDEQWKFPSADEGWGW
ncbi:MAG: exonuclease [Calditrichaeota bacterium]|nr:MAG: exonuclease [Calditrichota bacterium]